MLLISQYKFSMRLYVEQTSDRTINLYQYCRKVELRWADGRFVVDMLGRGVGGGDRVGVDDSKLSFREDPSRSSMLANAAM